MTRRHRARRNFPDARDDHLVSRLFNAFSQIIPVLSRSMPPDTGQARIAPSSPAFRLRSPGAVLKDLGDPIWANGASRRIDQKRTKGWTERWWTRSSYGTVVRRSQSRKITAREVSLRRSLQGNCAGVYRQWAAPVVTSRRSPTTDQILLDRLCVRRHCREC